MHFDNFRLSVECSVFIHLRSGERASGNLISGTIGANVNGQEKLRNGIFFEWYQADVSHVIVIDFMFVFYVHSMQRFASISNIFKLHKGGFTQNPVTAYEPAYGQRQSSHMLHWPFPAEFSRFRTAYGLLKIGLNKPDCRGCRYSFLAACVKTAVGHKQVRKP